MFDSSFKKIQTENKIFLLIPKLILKVKINSESQQLNIIKKFPKSILTSQNQFWSCLTTLKHANNNI